MSRAAKPEAPDPGIVDPADRTRLAWTRTAISFAAIGAAMLKSSPVAGVIVLALTLPCLPAPRPQALGRSVGSGPGGYRGGRLGPEPAPPPPAASPDRSTRRT